MWNDDPILRPGGALHGQGNAVFRVTGYFPYAPAHPYRMPDQWQALLDCFLPLVRAHCDRIILWDRPGAKARRGKRIVEADWRPFHHLLTVEQDVAHGIFTGFSFLDRRDALEGNGRGPCSVRFFVGSTIRFDACIPVDDWLEERLDIAATIAALQALPHVSFTAGYGLRLGALAVGYDDGASTDALIAYARRYPLIDVALEEDRSFFPGAPEDYPAIGIGGVNWLTGIGEPFRTRLGDASGLGRDAPAGVEITDGPHGVVVRLGPQPTSGEAAVDDAALPLCHWLGRRLSAVYSPSAQDPRAPVFGAMAKAESLSWERRFFDEAG